MLDRRNFIRIVGSTAVVAAAGGAYWTQTRRPAAALAPWQPGEFGDPRMQALSYAILSPNPHNRQPWMVDLSTPDVIELYCDLDRLLPETDPFDRQITIGLGCFLETLRMALAQDGYAAEIIMFPQGETSAAAGERLDARPVARITIRKDGATKADPLFSHVLARRSLKEPFDTGRPVASDILAKLNAAGAYSARIETTNDSAAVSRLRQIAWEGHRIEVLTPAKLKESIDLMRIGRREIELNPDGIDLGGPFLEGISLLGMLNRDELSDPASMAFKQGMEKYREIHESAMAYVWIISSGNTRHHQLDAGRDWVRINLAATGLGIGLHPVSQALQEYPEMRELYASIRTELACSPDETVQMFGRIGYGPQTEPSPRWPLETRLLRRG